jgi:hypothetical protein
MKEPPNPDSNEELRAKTLDNNLTWLESFGCEIRRGAEIIHVRHLELPEYNASLIIGSSKDILEKVRALSDDLRLSQGFVFVDSKFLTDDMTDVLSHSGLNQLLVSRIKTTRFTLPSRNTKVQLTLAQASDLAQWAELYSKGFQRSGSAALADKSRWRKSFAHPKVRNWFFVSEAEKVGVCQTCIDNDVVGVYSLTLIPGCRDLSTVIRSARALRNEIVRQGETMVYFERVRALKPNLSPLPSRLNNLKVVREFIGYGIKVP